MLLDSELVHLYRNNTEGDLHFHGHDPEERGNNSAVIPER